MKAYLFLDTNTLLHYTNFDEIPWASLFKLDEVVLVITITVLNEIDTKKYDSRDSIQKRARSVSKLIDRLEDGVSVREDVTIKYIAKEPRVNWDAYELDKDVNDDRILAAFINYKCGNNEEKYLVTQDGNFRRKANAFGVNCLTLPDELELELTTDAEKELRKLKAESTAIKVQRPELSLMLLNGSDLGDFYEFRYVQPSLMDENEMRTALEEAREQAKLWAATGYGDVGYAKKYENYLIKLRDYEYKSKALMVLEFVLINEGAAPANTVIYKLAFPSYLKISEYDNLLEKAEKPEPPDLTPFFLQGISNIDITPYRTERIELPNLRKAFKLDNETIDIYEGINNIIVEINCKQVLQKQKLNIGKLYVLVEDHEYMKSFTIPYEMVCAEPPSDKEGELHIRVLRE